MFAAAAMLATVARGIVKQSSSSKACVRADIGKSRSAFMVQPNYLPSMAPMSIGNNKTRDNIHSGCTVLKETSDGQKAMCHKAQVDKLQRIIAEHEDEETKLIEMVGGDIAQQNKKHKAELAKTVEAHASAMAVKDEEIKYLAAAVEWSSLTLDVVLTALKGKLTVADIAAALSEAPEPPKNKMYLMPFLKVMETSLEICGTPQPTESPLGTLATPKATPMEICSTTGPTDTVSVTPLRTLATPQATPMEIYNTTKPQESPLRNSANEMVLSSAPEKAAVSLFELLPAQEATPVVLSSEPKESSVAALLPEATPEATPLVLPLSPMAHIEKSEAPEVSVKPIVKPFTTYGDLPGLLVNVDSAAAAAAAEAMASELLAVPKKSPLKVLVIGFDRTTVKLSSGPYSGARETSAAATGELLQSSKARSDAPLSFMDFPVPPHVNVCGSSPGGPMETSAATTDDLLQSSKVKSTTPLSFMDFTVAPQVNVYSCGGPMETSAPSGDLLLSSKTRSGSPLRLQDFTVPPVDISCPTNASPAAPDSSSPHPMVKWGQLDAGPFSPGAPSPKDQYKIRKYSGRKRWQLDNKGSRLESRWERISCGGSFGRSSFDGSEASFEGQATLVSDSSSSSLGSSTSGQKGWDKSGILGGYEASCYSKAPLLSESSVASSVGTPSLSDDGLTPRLSDDGGASWSSSPEGSRRSSLASSISYTFAEERPILFDYVPQPEPEPRISTNSRVTQPHPLGKTQHALKTAAARASLAAPTRSSAAAAVKATGVTATTAAPIPPPKRPVSAATLKAQQRKAAAVGGAASSIAVKPFSKAAAVGASKAAGSTAVKLVSKVAGAAAAKKTPGWK